MEEWNSSAEIIAMSLIANSGAARSLAFEALKKAKLAEFDAAKELMDEANSVILKAHHSQTDLLQEEAQGNGHQLSILLVHAQDHFMTSLLAIDLITEMIELYSNREGERQCAAGMSTSILMKKMEQYANDQGIDLDIKAVGLMDYQDYAQEYDVILLGPQVSYKLDSVKETVSKPVATIPAMDYAMGDCKNIFQLIKAIS